MNEKEQKTEEKQKLHMRLLDAQDAVLISCEGNSVSVDGGRGVSLRFSTKH